jgi:dTDP-4-dehydrorhamnose 3,5-epimerase
MKFNSTDIDGLYYVDIDRLKDERGFFGRAFCRQEFDEIGLDSEVCQANISYNQRAGTLRGMHYQKPPYQESKFIRCIRGSIYDVVIDLRKNSPTYCHSFGIELNDENRTALFVPKDFAHGFVTLTDDTEVIYMVSQSYVPNAEEGIRWDDPVFAIDWPINPSLVSSKDAQWPDFVT